MDNSHSGSNERGLSGTCLNGNADGGVAATRGRLGSGAGARVASLSDSGGVGGGGMHHHHHHHHAAGTSTAPIITVVVRKDENGYGMKVSGDNPVYVQSVKTGGAAAKAGLHHGDKIIKVNGVDVSKSTHTEVVALIRSAAHVNLTVQQRPSTSTRPTMGSPGLSLHHAGNRPLSAHPNNNTRITAPQPVDHEIMRDLENKRVYTFRLMLEKEQRYAETLRSELASFTVNNDPAKVAKVTADLAAVEKNVGVLHTKLQSLLKNPVSELSASPSVSNTLPRSIPSSSNQSMTHSKSDNQITEKPPPLPERNRAATKSGDQNSDRTSNMSPTRNFDKRFVFNDESHNLIMNTNRNAIYKNQPKNFTPPLKTFLKTDVSKHFLQSEINSNSMQNAQPQVGNKQYVIENQLYHSKNKSNDAAVVDAHNNVVRDASEHGSYSSPHSNRPMPADPVVRSFSNAVDSKRYKPTKTHKHNKNHTIDVPPYAYNESTSRFYVDPRIDYCDRNAEDIVTNLTDFNVSGTCHFEPDACPSDPIPPPLPPRIPLASPSTVITTVLFPTSSASSSGCNDPDAVNSINKQMSYPLVATCAALVNHSCNSKSPHIVNTHHRTKSGPDPLTPHISPTKRMPPSGSMTDLSENAAAGCNDSWEMIEKTEHDTPSGTPPGTPPPPYPSPHLGRSLNISGRSMSMSGGSQRSSGDHSDGIHLDESPMFIDPSSEASPQYPGSTPFLLSSSPIMAASSNVIQQPIISMEDELSDQEAEQIENNGPFKSLIRLLEHPAHLAIFVNFLLSNSEPNYILFYLITDLYKKDKNQVKDLKKWAYEIHSSFLIPGAPLRLRNIDENLARDIDDILFHESDKEDILRKVFWKTRTRAEEEIEKQLAEFRTKRCAGLGSFYGPPDSQLEESIHDKTKENKIIEDYLLKKLDQYIDDFESESIDASKLTMAAALSTIFVRIFGLKQPHNVLERCPTFVSKDKSLRLRFIGKNRKLQLRGHHFVAHQYYTITYCNCCQFLISGIGPQAYQCSDCNSNIHRHCVKFFEENCPGPLVKKEKGGYPISKIMGKIRPDLKSQSDTKRKTSSTHNFLHNERERRLLEEKDQQTDNEANNGERPFPSAPVSRAGSDRRSDASETLETPDQELDNEQIHDNLNRTQRPKNTQSSINRSESYKEHPQKRRQVRERRKVSDPNLSKSNDVEPESQGLSYTNSGSSSNSSLSSSSPSTSLEAVPMAVGCTANTRIAGDSDPETERLADPSDWASTVPEDLLSRLSGCEKKRQEVFNELFQTERSHVRQLRVLRTIFHKPLLGSNLLSSHQISLLFPNLDEMLNFHSTFCNDMKALRKENPLVKDIGETLLKTFDGEKGEDFQKEASIFCAKQQIALEWLKDKRHKDQKLHAFLSECESDKLCKRLQLKDLIPTGMLRLTKYPLLFENLVKYTEQCLKDENSINPLCSEELSRILRAHDRSKEILNFVNATVREAEDLAKLQDFQKRLDRSGFEKTEHPITVEFKNIDLTKHKLIHEGPLHWRIGTRQKISLHVLLLQEIIILLQKQDEKYSLKFHNVSGTPGLDRMSPIIKVSTVLVRSNATNPNSLFLINTAQMGEHMYELVASSPSECKLWFRHISEATELYIKSEGRIRSDLPASIDTESDNNSESTLVGTDNRNTECDNTSIDESRSSDNNSLVSQSQDGGVTPTDRNEEDTVLEHKRLTQIDDGDSPSTQGPNLGSQGSLNRFGAHSPLTYCREQSQLIPPSEVHISVRPVLTAEPVLTPLEQLRRKDELVKQTLSEKEMLVADILSVPRDDFKDIADLSTEYNNDKEPTELVLGAIHLSHQLIEAINEASNITDETTIALTTLPNATTSHLVVGCSGNSPKLNRLPGVPIKKLSSISSTLNSQLTELLKKMKERDEEREKLRRELHRSREQIHILHEIHRLHPDIMVNAEETLQINRLTPEQIENGVENSRRSTVIEDSDIIKEEPSDCEEEDINDSEDSPKNSNN